jgi:uncharacterized protein
MIARTCSVPADKGAPLTKVFRSAYGTHFLVVPHSRIYDLPEDLLGDDAALPSELLTALANTMEGEEPLEHVAEPAPQSITLNVSSSCNLSCSYCYADQGSFSGAQPRPMPWDVARAAIDTLLRNADASAPITVGFLGGEPFANRLLIHRAVEYAAREGRRLALDVRFAVTTNGTLLTQDDLSLLRRYAFAVTVSVDGGEAIQNIRRPLRNGSGSFKLLQEATRSLLIDPGAARVAARATVGSGDHNLSERFDAILNLGFREVGFSPLRAAGPGAGAFADDDWRPYLAAIVSVAKSELAQARHITSLRLTNLAVALKQLYRGASTPYPCGAGGGYFSVSAAGDWYACHRAIGVDAFRLGNNRGLDPADRRTFLVAAHVHSQEPCRHCWARYLCSGGCHQERSRRSESSCDFIRGWLEFCLGAYCDVLERFPDFFSCEHLSKLR